MAATAGDDPWQPPSLDGLDVVAQPHCHQHATSGYTPDTALLREAGASVTAIAGCCGLAGNFGMEAGHYDVSVAVAENGLLPALRDAPEGRCCSRTASPAGRRPTTSPGCGACTSPSCSPLVCDLSVRPQEKGGGSSVPA